MDGFVQVGAACHNFTYALNEDTRKVMESKYGVPMPPDVREAGNRLREAVLRIAHDHGSKYAEEVLREIAKDDGGFRSPRTAVSQSTRILSNAYSTFWNTAVIDELRTFVLANPAGSCGGGATPAAQSGTALGRDAWRWSPVLVPRGSHPPPENPRLFCSRSVESPRLSWRPSCPTLALGLTVFSREWNTSRVPPLDINREKLLTLKEASDRYKIPKGSIWKYVRYGTNGIYLAARKMGRKWYTSEEAVQRFTDAITAAVIAVQFEPQPASIASPWGPTIRANQKADAKSLDEAERSLRAHGMFGDHAVFDKSKVSKDLLIDLHEFIENWMPGGGRSETDCCQAVRSGIFRHAVGILEGKHGRSKSLATAIAWVESIDLKTFNVRQLYGVGPLYEAEWKELMAEPKFATTVRPPVLPKARDPAPAGEDLA